MFDSSTMQRNVLTKDIKDPKLDLRTTVDDFRNTSSATKTGKARRPTCSSWPISQWWLIAIPAFFVSAYGVAFFAGLTIGDPRIQNRIRSSVGGVTHISGALVAMGIGPFQFLPHLRQKYPKIHRWIGWVYVVAVTVGGIAAFQVSLQSSALLWGKLGFALLALAWLETCRRSIVAIWRDKNIKEHEAWMIRNFALTYAAVVLRLCLPLMIAMGMRSDLALSFNGYISWIPNLVFVEYLVLKRGR